MISKESIHIDWINRASAENRKADRVLVEKVVRVLLLLEGLAQSDMSFVFKGGTAVMLLQGSPKRFSIDADIMVPEKKDFDPIFNGFLNDKGFKRYELQERGSFSSIEKYHYKFFYNPAIKGRAEEDYVLLDIIVENPRYRRIMTVNIDSPFVLQQGEPIDVRVPSEEDILGDKLSAFAPNTTGVPYEKRGFSMAMEIIKQLYDIGNLFDNMSDIKNASQTFKIFAETEMEYRGISGDTDVVLDDIVQTALCLSLRGRAGNGDFKALQDGISRISAYIFSESYHIEKAIVHAARAAYCAALIRAGADEIRIFNGADDVADWKIDAPFPTGLNKLKKSNPEAFFYWYQAGLLEMSAGAGV